MKLWSISQNVNDNWDTYSDAVVVAETEEAARQIFPRKYLTDDVLHLSDVDEWDARQWTDDPTKVIAVYLGEEE